MTLFTTGCSRCKMLKKLLDEKGMTYTVCDDADVMNDLGFFEAPMLEHDGKYLNFVEAVMWLNQNGGAV